MLAQKGEVLPGEFQRRVIDVGAEDAGDSVSMQECESGEEVEFDDEVYESDGVESD